jgi:hypothetical protein
MEVEYVNYQGGRVSTKAPTNVKSAASKVKLKRVFHTDLAKEHRGFEVVSVRADAEALADAERAFNRKKANEKKTFDPEAYIRSAKQKRAIKRVYGTVEASDLAAAMLRKDTNHRRIAVLPILFG